MKGTDQLGAWLSYLTEMQHTSLQYLYKGNIIGPLVFMDFIYQHAHRVLKSLHIKDWCDQSWSMVVQLRLP